MLKSLGLAAMMLIASGCASQSGGNSTTQNLTQDNDNLKAVKEQVASAIQCRYIVQTGTRFGTRVCMKKKDWDVRYKRTSDGAQQEMDVLSRTAAQTNYMKGQGQ